MERSPLVHEDATSIGLELLGLVQRSALPSAPAHRSSSECGKDSCDFT